jgi:hypothetical protein
MKDPSAEFDRNVMRLKVVGGVFLGAFLAGIATLVWGDTRYLRRTEFESHATTQSGEEARFRALEQHALEDAQRFVTRQEFKEHVALPAHAKAQRVNEIQDARIHALERNQSWIASALFAIARRNGVHLPPPPELGGVIPEPSGGD